MAEYTIELRSIIESGINIFDFPYEFYNEEKRREFEQKFIRHFYFREIGCETVDRFKWYLEDKMQTVFPYYNELFKSASIEYDILDNYKLTETYTRNIENSNKQSGISSTVGQIFGEQTSETTQNKTVDTIGTLDSLGNETETETGNTTTEATGTSNGTTSETVNADGTKTNEGSGSSSQNTTKKFLDTPQGLTDLTNSKYLTNLGQDTTESTQTNEGSETTKNTTTTNGTSETETTDSTETDTTRNVTKNSSVEQDTTGKETTADNVTGSSHNEQKTTTDNNTRTYSNGEQNETYTLTRRGNIGVDTDSDAIEKHNRLQKTLRNIERMFFDECEDLFMLVF